MVCISIPTKWLKWTAIAADQGASNVLPFIFWFIGFEQLLILITSDVQKFLTFKMAAMAQKCAKEFCPWFSVSITGVQEHSSQYVL